MGRRVFAIIEVDDDKAIAEDKGTGEYLEREFGCLEQSGIDLKHWLIADDDDAERWARYINYLIEWAFYHSDNMYADSSPACYDEWCDNEDGDNELIDMNDVITRQTPHDVIERQDVLKIRNTSAVICSLFEELLDKYDFTVPSDDRTGDPCEARLFGEPYFELEDYVTDLLLGVCEIIKHNPGIMINSEEY